jgi:hypothetical protein
MSRTISKSAAPGDQLRSFIEEIRAAAPSNNPRRAQEAAQTLPDGD